MHHKGEKKVLVNPIRFDTIRDTEVDSNFQNNRVCKAKFGLVIFEGSHEGILLVGGEGYKGTLKGAHGGQQGR
jgi:hypothetical protein